MTWDLLLGLATAAASSWAAIGSLGWWLSGRFRAVEKSTAELVDRHEAVDQNRHEDNLRQFANIQIMLAGYGIDGRNRLTG